MPRRPPRPCARHGCPALVDATFTGCVLGLGAEECPQQRIPWKSSDRRARLPKDWPRRRRRVLRRDGGLCARCGAPATQVDHVVAGDDHRDENLQSLCDGCHRAKTLEEAARGRRR